jgi:copper(I)-binding protein
MNDFNRRTLLQAGLLLSAGLGGRQARACEFFAATLRVSHPWTRAAPQSAEYALVSMRFDDVTADDRLLSISTPVAEAAELVVEGRPAPLPLDIPAGQTTVLGETGLQVRLLKLTQPLEMGRSYPMRLVFEKGGAINALLNIDYGRFS